MLVLRVRSKIGLAVTAMIDVALNSHSGPVPLSQISERHKISISYLEEVFSKLMARRLVKSTRGPGGGYSLAKKSESISLADIAFAVDGSMGQDASLIGGSLRSEIWANFNKQVLKQLSAISLRQLLHEQQERLEKVIAV